MQKKVNNLIIKMEKQEEKKQKNQMKKCEIRIKQMDFKKTEYKKSVQQSEKEFKHFAFLLIFNQEKTKSTEV